MAANDAAVQVLLVWVLDSAHVEVSVVFTTAYLPSWV